MKQSSVPDRERFRSIVLTNPFIAAVLDRCSDLGLEEWYLTGGCLFQTVWNVEHGFDPARGILDYDVFYFDRTDTSAAAEGAVATNVARLCGDLPVKLEARNQARVHVWYEQEFNAPCRELERCEDGIDHFLASSCSFGLRQTATDLAVYAPYGFSDVFDLVVRPNAVRATGSPALGAVYQAKVERWMRLWPRLQVLPWPGAASGAAPP